MKVAIPFWRGRVSPVFDVARNVLVVDIADGVEQARRETHFDIEGPQARANRLAEIGADALICGAISWPLEMAVSAAGIEVFPQNCGDIEQVLAAFTDGRLHQGAFLMPGCSGRRWRFRMRRRRGKN